MTLLLNRPVLNTDESLASYAIRLAMANYCQPLTIFINPLLASEETGSSYDDLQLPKNVRTFTRLAAYTGTEVSRLYEATLHRYASILIPPEYKVVTLALAGKKQPILSGNRDTTFVRAANAAQYCPRCLAESGYHRLNWSLTFVTVCLKHRCLLVDFCQNCQSKVSIKAITLGRCSRCDSNLTTETSVGLADNDESWFFQEIVAAWLSSEEEPSIATSEETVGSLPREKGLVQQAQFGVEVPALLLKVLAGLRDAVAETKAAWPYHYRPVLVVDSDTSSEPNVTVSENISLSVTYTNHCAYVTAFRGLRAWPLGFYEFLEAYRQIEYRTNTPSDQDPLNLGVLYDLWLSRRWNKSGYYWVQASFKQYEAKQKALSYKYVQMKTIQGRNPNKLPYLTLVAAARFVDLDIEDLQELVETGLIQGYVSNDNSSKDVATNRQQLLLKRTELEQLKASGRLEELKQLMWVGHLLGVQNWKGYLQWTREGVEHC